MIARKVSSFPRISFQGGDAKTAPIAAPSRNWHDSCLSLFEPASSAQPRLKPPFDGDIRCS
ncbi:predicted protein [Brucella abortus bv. 4 str. 292]|uniref:Uncharacterized protein n=2 Tax=Brucella TaxID=234 RepID=A0A0E1WYT4_9HYPH|nr:hypothetical protein CJP68_08695 [Brucella melitensis]ASU72656.1 hypothetical protein CJP69_01450 [Brucella abortus]ATN20696.1 hypothetical protein CRN66_13185 [Brucella canis]EEW80001.1 predicted protein [Brucella abortus NCTC 8038]EEW92212.1 predicted protein [Brucella suis bv. 4 str. 40]EEX56059.1 predicted protein [Brucella abortus bv. 4 str. 292]EEX57778.1 predicted protein [Brucella abortus bv. 2 str. 86/8/59]EEX86189.1 predicted protein [Brucella ceti B1/94]EEY26819.1 predicted pr